MTPSILLQSERYRKYATTTGLQRRPCAATRAAGVGYRRQVNRTSTPGVTWHALNNIVVLERRAHTLKDDWQDHAFAGFFLAIPRRLAGTQATRPRNDMYGRIRMPPVKSGGSEHSSSSILLSGGVVQRACRVTPSGH